MGVRCDHSHSSIPVHVHYLPVNHFCMLGDPDLWIFPSCGLTSHPEETEPIRCLIFQLSDGVDVVALDSIAPALPNSYHVPNSPSPRHARSQYVCLNVRICFCMCVCICLFVCLNV